jgi:hypothetical protein
MLGSPSLLLDRLGRSDADRGRRSAPSTTPRPDRGAPGGRVRERADVHVAEHLAVRGHPEGRSWEPRLGSRRRLPQAPQARPPPCGAARLAALARRRLIRLGPTPRPPGGAVADRSVAFTKCGQHGDRQPLESACPVGAFFAPNRLSLQR